MADNVKVRPSTDNTAVNVATDDIGGVHYPEYKQGYGVDGSYTPVSAGNPLPVTDYYLELVKGNIAGQSVVNKFGQNDDLNTSTFEDIWDVGGVYSWPADSTAPITHVDSTDAGDTGPVEVQGLDVDGVLTVQTATLNGTTLVELDTPLWRVFRLKNTGSSDYVGTVQAVNSGDTAVYARVAVGNNQTLMALYTIPSGKTGYLFQGSANMSKVTRSVSASGRFLVRPFGGVFQLKNTFGVGSDGGGHIMPFPMPMQIPAKSDLRVEAIASANGAAMNATFALLLIDD